MDGSVGQQFTIEGLVFGHLSMDSRGVTVHMSTSDDAPARCPLCQRPSFRTHSRHVRTVHDLPWRGVRVALRVQTRRFFCDDPSCERRIFCERLSEITPRARKTDRLEQALLAIAFKLSDRAGARLAAELGLLAGRDTLLTRLKSVVHSGSVEHLKVVGIELEHRSRRRLYP